MLATAARLRFGQGIAASPARFARSGTEGHRDVCQADWCSPAETAPLFRRSSVFSRRGETRVTIRPRPRTSVPFPGDGTPESGAWQSLLNRYFFFQAEEGIRDRRQLLRVVKR